jgi:hypothetical protein
VPTTLIAKNLMQAHMWGLKTFYYSLINKAGSKAVELPTEVNGVQTSGLNGYHEVELEDDCEACKL